MAIMNVVVSKGNATLLSFLHKGWRSLHSFQMDSDGRQRQSETITLLDDTDKWLYLVRDRNPPFCWKNPDSCPIDWSEGVASDVPLVLSNVTYYSTSFWVQSLSESGYFHLVLTVRGGMIVYLNGIEVYRVNLPEEVNRDSSIIASSCTRPEKEETVTIPLFESPLREGFNSISVETYRCVCDPYPYPLRLSLLLQMGSSSVNARSQHAASVSAVAPWKDENAFDDDDGTFFGTQTACKGVFFLFTFNQSLQYFVSGYRIHGAKECLSHHPTAWALYGLNATSHAFDLLHEVRYSPFERDETKEFSLSSNTHYGVYKFLVVDCANLHDECKDRSLFFGGVSLLMGPLPGVCFARDGYPNTLSGKTALIPCDAYYATSPSYRSRKCVEGDWEQEVKNCSADMLLYSVVEGAPFLVGKKAKPCLVLSKSGVRDMSFSSLTGPSGLTISEKGVVYGTPREVYDRECKVESQQSSSQSIVSVDCRTFSEKKRSFVFRLDACCILVAAVESVVFFLVLGIRLCIKERKRMRLMKLRWGVC